MAQAEGIKIVQMKRGGKKLISLVVGLAGYVPKIEDMAKVMGKKFATGASVVDDDKHGENCIQLNGDIMFEDKFYDFVESDLAKYGVTADMVEAESAGNQKGRKPNARR
jgi:translation initiation factor 1 (eIF-1/SUI1)